jgi:hypothetical protein
VAALILLTSHPMSNGALLIAHREKCVTYSASVIPPLPTSSTAQKHRSMNQIRENEQSTYYRDHSNHQVLLYQQTRYSTYTKKDSGKWKMEKCRIVLLYQYSSASNTSYPEYHPLFANCSRHLQPKELVYRHPILYR